MTLTPNERLKITDKKVSIMKKKQNMKDKLGCQRVSFFFFFLIYHINCCATGFLTLTCRIQKTINNKRDLRLRLGLERPETWS